LTPSMPKAHHWTAGMWANHWQPVLLRPSWNYVFYHSWYSKQTFPRTPSTEHDFTAYSTYARQIPIHRSVMHVKFTHGFLLGRNFKILLLSYSGRDRSVTAAQVSNTYQFITLLLRLNPAVTWSDHHTFRNAWLVTSNL